MFNLNSINYGFRLRCFVEIRNLLEVHVENEGSYFILEFWSKVMASLVGVCEEIM
jgi:hypothetical protein